MSPNNIEVNDDLLVKNLLNETDAREAVRIQEWLEASVENKKYYQHLQLIWEKSLQLAETDEGNESLAWNKLENTLKFNDPTPIVKPLFSKYWMSLAASIAIICGLSWYAINWYQSKNEPYNMTVQATSDVLIQLLPDGSKVTLNKNSILTYSSKFTGKTRSVKLQGEAFFNITPDHTKPFIIRVSDVTVKVVGTSFNVKSRNGKTVVMVETGIVDVSKLKNSVELHPGERVLINEKENSLLKESSKSKLYNYYRTNELICDHTPLQELVDVLNEIHHTNIVIEDSSLQNKPITANFKNQPLNEVLDVISKTFDITVERRNQQILLK